jgi:uncharacterized BrkB/YihY/UPF0761 family membrane protein
MNVGAPFAVSALTFALAYVVVPSSTPWYSPLAISALIAMAGIEFVVLLAIGRVGKRFDKA